MLQLNVQCWWLWRSLVFAQYQALPMHWRKPQTNLRSVESPSQLSCMSKDLPVCSMEKKMLNIWKTIAGKSADQNPAIYFFISIWNIRENFSPRLVAPGRLWSPWEAPSSPHLAPGGCLEGQPPEDRLAMILKKKTFSWSRQEPSFQLIKTITKFSADQNLDQIFNSDLVQSPLFHNVPAGKLHLHILTISPRGALLQILPDLSIHILPI